MYLLRSEHRGTDLAFHMAEVWTADKVEYDGHPNAHGYAIIMLALGTLALQLPIGAVQLWYAKRDRQRLAEIAEIAHRDRQLLAEGLEGLPRAASTSAQPLMTAPAQSYGTRSTSM